MNDNILVDIGSDGEFVGISTYERKHVSRGRFLFAWAIILKVLMGKGGMTTLDTDCGHFAEVWREDEELWIRFTWLNTYGNVMVQGFKQTIRIPKSLLLSMLGTKCRRKYLCQPIRRQAKIDASNVCDEIRLILKNKYTRRAFIRAMRDCFKWPGDEVTLYRDGTYSFYFTTKSGFPKCGGLVLHESGPNPYRPEIYYAIHT